MEFATGRLLVTLKKGISLTESYNPDCGKIKRWVQGGQTNFSTILATKRKHTECVIPRKKCMVKIMVIHFLTIHSKIN